MISRMMSRTFCASLLVVLLSALSPRASAQTQVVTTTGIVADMVEHVAGECANVSALLGPGIDPHAYRATAGDVRTLQAADLVFYLGYDAEVQMTEVLRQLARARRGPTVALSEAALDRDALITMGVVDHGDHVHLAGVDPHVWMDPSLWAETAEVVAAEIAALEPTCTDILNANAAAYQTELRALHEWIATTTATIPKDKRVIITPHDGFGYFARAYGFETHAVQGLATAAEASLSDVRRTVERVVESRVPAIFPHSSINPRTIQAVQAAARDRGMDVTVGAELYGDAMGAAGTPEGTFIGMHRHNVMTLVETLGGELAPWPELLSGWATVWALD